MPQSEIYERVRIYLEKQQPFHLQLLRQMVSINSFTANPEGVNALAELTAAAFAKLGFTAETVQSANPLFGKHLVLTKHGRSRHKIGLVSHLDTVFPPDEEIGNDFTWREEGGRIYGPGTVDIKGGTIVMYMMMAALKKMVPDVYDDVTWVALLDASEEASGEDFGRLCLERLHGNTLACLIFEGGYMRDKEAWIVVARKGMATYRISVEGRASHAGNSHDKGANAIVQMADIVQQVDTFTDYERDLTFNVGTVAGGTVVNRVPHFASAGVEMRAFAPDVYQDGIARMMALNGISSVSSANGDFPCQVEVEITRKTAPWPRNEGTDRLFAVWQEAADSLGFRVVPEERGGLSDGNYFWDRIPTIDGLGAAGGNAHCSERSPDGSKDQEYCLPASFVPKALLNVAAILKLVQKQTSIEQE